MKGLVFCSRSFLLPQVLTGVFGNPELFESGALNPEL